MHRERFSLHRTALLYRVRICPPRQHARCVRTRRILTGRGGEGRGVCTGGGTVTAGTVHRPAHSTIFLPQNPYLPRPPTPVRYAIHPWIATVTQGAKISIEGRCLQSPPRLDSSPRAPLQYRLFAPELQWQSRGYRRILQECKPDQNRPLTLFSMPVQNPIGAILGWVASPSGCPAASMIWLLI